MADYSPPYTEEDANFDARVDKADKIIRKTRLNQLTVGDLMFILEVYKHGYLDPGPSDLCKIEKLFNIKKA
jgi:hypothetical protein